MRVAVLQSSYVPWKGYFSLIDLVDHFVLYDDVQFTSRDWRNRNRIRTSQGLRWVSIPILVKGRRYQRVRDARVSDPGWAERHWRMISQSYSHAPHFGETSPFLQALYEECAAETSLSTINRRFLEASARRLGITTPLSWSMEYSLVEGRSERLVDLCRQLGADEYLTGPAARAYLDESPFDRAGIRVRWMDYRGYPDYSQVHGSPCIHEVSVLDLLMNLGRVGAAAYIAGFRRTADERVFGPTSGQAGRAPGAGARGGSS